MGWPGTKIDGSGSRCWARSWMGAFTEPTSVMTGGWARVATASLTWARVSARAGNEVARTTTSAPSTTSGMDPATLTPRSAACSRVEGERVQATTRPG
ncbi:MAG: hypothetical protein WKF43_05265 [Acidimicrobiales bacterium]